MKRTIRGVFWDLDGTLIDSEDSHASGGEVATELVATRYNLRVRPLLEDTVGKENRVVFDGLFGSELRQQQPHIFTEWEQLAIDEALLRINSQQQINQFVALFKYFAAQGIAQAVVSNSTQRVLEHCLTILALQPSCPQFFSRDVVTAGKPDPELYLRALAHHKLAAAECVAFEDSRAGISAARAAGLTVLGIGNTPATQNADLILPLDRHDWLSLLESHFTF